MKRWFAAMSLASLQWFNALIGGDPQMTPSARAAFDREMGGRGGRVACRMLDWMDPHDGDSPKGDHCDIAMKNYMERESGKKVF